MSGGLKQQERVREAVAAENRAWANFSEAAAGFAFLDLEMRLLARRMEDERKERQQLAEIRANLEEGIARADKLVGGE